MHPSPFVRLEPDLEAIAGDLTPAARLLLARKLTRWARQLRVSAAILRRRAPTPRPALAPLPARQIRGN
jgi:hypothetical protein